LIENRTFIAAFAIFASSALAVKYAAGDICHSNVECEANCLDKQYTVADQDGGFVFVCDPSIADPKQWYNMACLERDILQHGGMIWHEELTKTACKSIGGQACSYCVVSAKRSEDEDLRNKWTKACNVGQKRSDKVPQIKVMADEESAKKYCNQERDEAKEVAPENIRHV
jgi:hypothetical protein